MKKLSFSKMTPPKLEILYHQSMTLDRGRKVGLHQHPHWQAELLLEGAIDVIWPQHRESMPVKRILFIPPGHDHGFHYRQRSRFLSFKFAHPPAKDPFWATPSPLHDNVVEQLQLLSQLDDKPSLAASLSIALARHSPPPRDLLSSIDRLCRERRGHFLSVTECAQEFHFSPGHLSAKFRSLKRGSLKAHLDLRRAQWAQSMLRFGDLGVMEVARSCDFPDAPSFTRFYKRVMGHLPSKDRQHRR